jgi:hypothetical protein
LGVGRKDHELALKKYTIANVKELKTGCNLEEFCKEGNDCKRALSPMMTMMMIIYFSFNFVHGDC